MLNVTINTIPHSKQRYDTCGDYTQTKEGFSFRVSDLGNWRMEFLIALHELIEWALVMKAGVSIMEIDSFDMAYEARREAGDTTEPGDSPLAPYYKMHQYATMIEKSLASELGIDWDEYENKLETLNYAPKTSNRNKPVSLVHVERSKRGKSRGKAGSRKRDTKQGKAS